MPLAFLFVVVMQLGNPGNDGHLVALQAKMASVSNVTAEYEVIDSMSPPETLVSALNDSAKRTAKQDGAATTFSLRSGQEKHLAVFRFSDGRARYEKDGPDIIDLVESWTGDRHEQLTKQIIRGKAELSGVISHSNTAMPPTISAIEFALGLRLFGTNAWLSAKDLTKERVLDVGDDGLLRVQFPDPEIRDVSHVWKVDPSLGYRIKSYVFIRRNRDSKGEIKDSVEAELQCASFVKVDGIELPERVVFRTFLTGIPDLTGSERYQTMESTIHVRRYRLNDPANTKEGMRIVWPVGTSILDTRTSTTIDIVTRPQSLGDDTLAKIAKQQAEDE